MKVSSLFETPISGTDQHIVHINERQFTVRIRWGNFLILLSSDKEPPHFEDRPAFYHRDGDFHFIGDINYNNGTESKEPPPFIGFTTQGSFTKYYHWLLNQHKMEFPPDVLGIITAEEQRHYLGQKRLYPKLDLPSEQCEYVWTYRGQDHEPSDPDSYYKSGTSAFTMFQPTRFDGGNPRESAAIIPGRYGTAPEPVVRAIFTKWRDHFIPPATAATKPAKQTTKKRKKK